MSRKQDWTPRPKPLGWAVVNVRHPDLGDGPGEAAAVVANESGWVYAHEADAQDAAAALREEFGNSGILAVPVYWPAPPRARRSR